MNIKGCEIVSGKAFNIKENASDPIMVIEKNGESLGALLRFAKMGYPKVCFVGSSCMYPEKEQALREEMLGTGPVYEGNAPYSYSKLLGWQICKAAKTQFFVVIPSDIFGSPNDSHFIPQIMKKMHFAKQNNEKSVILWGTGQAIRHPLFEDDFDRILRQIAEKYEGREPINIAPPVSWAKSVASIARDIQEVVGYLGTIEWSQGPDGQKVKILDNGKLTLLGYAEFTPWKEALKKTYQRFLDENKDNV